MAVGGPQPFGWGPGYDQPQQPPSQPGYNAYPGPAGPAPPFPSVTPQPLGLAPGQPQMQPTNYAAIPPQGAVAQQGPVPQQPQPQPQQPQVTAANPSAGYGVMPVGGYAGQQANMPYSQQGPTPYPTQLQLQQQPNLAIQQPQSPVQPSQPQVQQPQSQVQQSQPQVQQPQPQGQPNQTYQPPQQLVQQPQPQPQPQPQQTQPQPQPQPHQPIDQQPAQAQPQPVQIIEQHDVQTYDVQTSSQAQFQPQPQQVSVSAQPQLEPQLQLVQEPVVHAQPLPQQQPQPQPEPQLQPSQSIPAQPISGLAPYPFDASYTYADQNVQAWANYYAQGGTDPTGSVYFISVPGVKEEGPAPNANQSSQQVLQQQNGSPRQSYHATQVLQPEQQTPSRTTSYQAQSLQGQARAQRTAEVSYFDPVGGLSNAAPGVALHQATANMPRYHLSDNPVPQSQPQGPQRGGPSRAGSGDNASEIPPSSPSNFTSTAPLNIKRAQSPSTPSWVLPKKTNGPGFGSHGNGGSPPPGGSHYQTVGSG